MTPSALLTHLAVVLEVGSFSRSEHLTWTSQNQEGRFDAEAQRRQEA